VVILATISLATNNESLPMISKLTLARVGFIALGVLILCL
jgi:hypothetical protein